MPKVEKEFKFFVLNLKDVEKYLSLAQHRMLGEIADAIRQGRKNEGKVPENNYIVCNQDEPYAEAVWAVILAGERRKSEPLMHKFVLCPICGEIVTIEPVTEDSAEVTCPKCGRLAN